MNVPAVDIFRGAFDKDAVRVETVCGLSNARQRMEEFAQATPERYFIFGQRSHAVLARIDTRKSVVLPFRRKPKAPDFSDYSLEHTLACLRGKVGTFFQLDAGDTRIHLNTATPIRRTFLSSLAPHLAGLG